MLLTDPALQYWSCVVAILATIAVLMLWNKVQGPRVVKGLSRVGLLIGGYATTAVAVLVSVNIAYGGLIVSVSDLFADVNPPMGQFMHHPCGAGPGQLDAKASPSAQVPDLAERQARAADPGSPSGRYPCTQTSASPDAAGQAAAAHPADHAGSD